GNDFDFSKPAAADDDFPLPEPLAPAAPEVDDRFDPTGGADGSSQPQPPPAQPVPRLPGYPYPPPPGYPPPGASPVPPPFPSAPAAGSPVPAAPGFPPPRLRLPDAPGLSPARRFRRPPRLPLPPAAGRSERARSTGAARRSPGNARRCLPVSGTSGRARRA